MVEAAVSGSCSAVYQLNARIRLTDATVTATAMQIIGDIET